MNKEERKEAEELPPKYLPKHYGSGIISPNYITALEIQNARLTRENGELKTRLDKIAERVAELRDGRRGMCDGEWESIEGIARGTHKTFSAKGDPHDR